MEKEKDQTKPQEQSTLTEQPHTAPMSPAPQKSKKKLVLLVSLLVVVLLVIGVVSYLLGSQNAQKQNPSPTPTIQVSTTPTPMQSTGSPTTTTIPADAGIPIGEKTVSFTRANGAVYLRYKNHVYSEEAASKNDASLTNLPNPNQYTWYGLVDAPAVPADLSGFDELFDFKVLPDKKNFIFIMRWPVDNTKTDYKLYLYDILANGNKVSLLYTSIQGQNGNNYTVPRIRQISNDGKYLALSMFACWNCGGHSPDTLLFNIQTKATKVIGKVSYFNWKDAGNYEYKEYKVIPCDPPLEGPGECSEDPDNLPLQTGSL